MQVFMLIARDRSLFMIIDMQERLLPVIDGAALVEANAGRLLTAARRLDIPVLASEQYPDGLGHTTPALAERLGAQEILPKTHFDASCESPIAAALAKSRRSQIVMVGAEAHVCVLQSALGFLGKGYAVAVVADAVASRTSASAAHALARLAANGVEVVTSEMVLFEWIGQAATPEFRDLLPVIK